MYRMGERRVLVVDDEVGVRNLLKTSLEIADYAVDTASDGVEALRLWEERAYGLVITDLVFLSGGIDLVQRIRAADDQVPILAMTGYGQEVAQEALDAGADHVLRKPFHLFEVRDLVERFIG